ncbi:MAG: CoA ester lyase [Chloroflexi bacterium]|nr:MAG: CoA ester lyase [Chloroflexota bacterium]
MSRLRIRSALFTPGTEAARLRKAVTTGADICIFDLEDSVPPARVGEARQIVSQALAEIDDRSRIWVRVHAATSAQIADDVAALPLGSIAGIMLPKVGDAAELAECRAAILASKGSALSTIPIIESASGVLNAAEIASTPDVLCLALGRFDLSADIGIDPEGGSPALAAARAAIVLASTARGLRPPLDSPWLKIGDLDGLGQAARRARADGFGGMLLIHPSHVKPVNDVFSPTADEISWARDILASSGQASAEGRGAYARGGAMVDEAIVRRARTIIEETSS